MDDVTKPWLDIAHTYTFYGSASPMVVRFGESAGATPDSDKICLVCFDVR
jgi:hypothetical protein